MKKYNLAKREGAYQKAPSGPRRGHIERAYREGMDRQRRQGCLGGRAERLRLFLGLYTLFIFFFLRYCVSLRCSSICFSASLC